MAFRLIMVGVATATLIASSAGCRRGAKETPPDVNAAAMPPNRRMQNKGDSKDNAASASTFVGSKTCHDCHEDFYKLWATSFHGLAMRPYTPEFGRKNLVPQIGEDRDRQDPLSGGNRRPWRTNPPARSRMATRRILSSM